MSSIVSVASVGSKGLECQIQVYVCHKHVGAHNAGNGHAAETGQQHDLTRTQQGWDRYVAAQLCGAKGSACQAKLVSALEAELAQPGAPPLVATCLTCWHELQDNS